MGTHHLMMENYFLLYVFLLGLISLFTLGDLGIYVYEKMTCKHTNAFYWSAYKK